MLAIELAINYISYNMCVNAGLWHGKANLLFHNCFKMFMLVYSFGKKCYLVKELLAQNYIFIVDGFFLYENVNFFFTYVFF
jgi:hypothetical protein